MDESELAKYPGLHARNGVWYVRKRVPSDLRHVEPREQIRLSLETGDHRTAVQRYPLKLAEITVGFERRRAELRDAGVIASALARGKIEDLGRGEVEQLVAKWWAGRVDAWSSADDGDDAFIDHAAKRQEAASLDADGDLPGRVVDRLLVDAGMAAYPIKVGRVATSVAYPIVDRQSAHYRYLRDLVARGLRVEEALAEDRALGKHTATYDPLFHPTGARGENADGVGKARTLRDLISEYRGEREVLHGKESTDRKYGLLFRIMEEVWGSDLPVASITRTRCIDILAFLRKLPPNATKRFPKLTLTEAVAHAEAKGLPGLASSSVASYMQGLNAILGWAERADWGVKANNRGLVTTRKAQVRRRGFRPDELTKLFGKLNGLRDTLPTKFWVPAVALMTGARAGEICQLGANDVVDVDGIWCLDLSEFDGDGRRVEGKRLKTSTSERFVPLHPDLIEIGFLMFVQSRKTDRLFPDLLPGPKGSYSHNFSKWFRRFRVKHGFNEPSLVFHSFRHGFRDACRSADIPEETALALGGWAGSNQASRYGDRGAVPVLHRAIQKIAFGDFKLPRSPA